MAHTGVRLLVINPIMAFLGPGIHSSSDQSLRQALFPLLQLAAKYQCVILLVRHLNKRDGSRFLYRGEGSIGFLGVCRSGWLIALDPEQPERSVLGVNCFRSSLSCTCRSSLQPGGTQAFSS